MGIAVRFQGCWFKKWSIVSNERSRFARSRARGQQRGVLAAALMITFCGAQPGAAQVTIQVNTTQQGVTSGQCSLQEAIYASEFKSNTAVGSTAPDTFYSTGCIAGTGNGDTIVLPPGAVFTFDHFWDGDAHNIFGPTATPVIFSKITIEGRGAILQWQDTFRPGNSRLFAIATVNDPNFPSGTGALTLRNVYVKGFHVKGGDGATGGGGGLGAGGAIYVGDGLLAVQNSTFESNGAIGGNGGGANDTSGGGGGLSGNGGIGCSNSGGGGGGSRGDGGKGGAISACLSGGGGGGGGGTVFSGGDGQSSGTGGVGGASGFHCGGNGGDAANDGHKASCPGAGGGGGGGGLDSPNCGIFSSCAGEGGDGLYGGGGGGGVGDGGVGGFGGGGGAGFFAAIRLNGGDGGFGGGGGSAWSGGAPSTHPGSGGPFGGHADGFFGGGGGALGGAIFNHNGVVRVENSTFFNNFVTRGVAGGGSAANGADAGGAIFSLDNTLEIANSTFFGNQSTGSGGAIVVYTDEGDDGGPGGGGAPVDFNLNNTIIAGNGANECFFTGSINVKGAGNLITSNGSGTGPFSPCPGVVSMADPQLQPLQLNSPGNTPTMAIAPISPAFNKADPATSLSTDQRGVMRPQVGGFDIGAFEARADEPIRPPFRSPATVLRQLRARHR